MVSKTTLADPGEPEPDPAEVSTLVPKDQVLAMLQAMTEVAATSTEDIEYNILAGYLAATSPEELLDVGTTVEVGDILGAPITLKAVHWNRSKVKGGPPVYAVLTAVRAGKPVTVTCGSKNVMTQAFMFAEKGWLPYDVVIDELAGETANGFKPMFMRAPLPGDEEAFAKRQPRPARDRSAQAGDDEEPF